MSNTSGQLGEEAKDVTEDLQRTSGTGGDTAQARLGQAGEEAAAYCQQGRDNSRCVGCACRQFVRERPLISVLMAAGVGWLLGRLWKRR
jgi:ElaB/YqjD/DUF883 family membrane-anchored ribosome-binding protein